MIPHVIVIDDFHPNPDALRERALKAEYIVGGRYPGLNSRQRVNINWLDDVIARIVGEPVHAPWSADFSHGHFRLALAKDDQEARIHIDLSDWTGVLYLTLPEHCDGGTEFYRHRPSNTDRVPVTLEALNRLGYADYAAMQHEILDTDALDRSKWERSMLVPMRYNRLVLLQPQYWHTAGKSFGTSVADGRLAYLMFFKRGRPG